MQPHVPDVISQAIQQTRSPAIKGMRFRVCRKVQRDDLQRLSKKEHCQRATGRGLFPLDCIFQTKRKLGPVVPNEKKKIYRNFVVRCFWTYI